MSAQAEEFARQLLEKTEGGKLKWQFVTDPQVEIYKYDAEDGISFNIKRQTQGDDKILTFELSEQGRVVLTDAEDNIRFAVNSELVREQAIAFMLNRRADGKLPIDTKIARFRLYSDLFYAARETAEGKDQAIEKAQQFLARLA